MRGRESGAVAMRWPLVGRGDELAIASETLEKHRSVVVIGPAGVGKMRHAHEVVV